MGGRRLLDGSSGELEFLLGYKRPEVLKYPPDDLPGYEAAMTAHLVMPSGHPGDAFLTSLAHTLEHDFGICHATVQIETTDHAGHACAPACQPRTKVA